MVLCIWVLGSDNFHPREVVDRGSETQLQVAENLNDLKCPLFIHDNTINMILILYAITCIFRYV